MVSVLKSLIISIGCVILAVMGESWDVIVWCLLDIIIGRATSEVAPSTVFSGNRLFTVFWRWNAAAPEREDFSREMVIYSLPSIRRFRS